MRKNLFNIKTISAAAILLVLLAAGAAYLFLVPQMVEDRVNDRLLSFGIAPEYLPSPIANLNGKMIYEDLVLDENGFITIKSLRLTYSPLSILLKQKFKTATIEGLTIIEDIADLKNPHAKTLSNLKMPNKPLADNINITKSQLTIQTVYGGATLGFDAIAAAQKDGTSVQTSLYLAQKNLRLKGQGQGVWNENGWWQIDLEIPEATIDTKALKMTRASGSLNLSGTSISDLEFRGALRADGLNLADHPWKSAALTLQGNLTTPMLYLSGKSTRSENLELTLTIPDLYTPALYNGTLFSEDPQNLKTFLSKVKTIAPPPDLSEKIPLTGATEINFENNAAGLFAEIIKTQPSPQLSMEDTTDSEEQPLIEENPWPKTIAFSVFPDNAPISLRGVSTLNTSQQNQIIAEITNASITSGTFEMPLSDAAVQSGKAENWFTCSLNDFKMNHSCVATLSLSHDNAPEFKQASIRFADGEVIITPPIGEIAEIKINLINLETLFSELSLGNWSGGGMITGTANIITTNQKPSLQNITLQSHGAGTIAITDPAFLKLLTAQEDEQALIHKALQNLHYDHFKVQADNIGGGQYRFLISTTGSNPALMNGHKFALSFDFEARLDKINALFFAP